MQYLADGDLARTSTGGSGGHWTDAAPYFRVFNPITQGEKFDPDGEYVRRFVPEQRDVPGGAVHRPWELPGGPPTATRGPSSTTRRSVGRPLRASSRCGRQRG